ncbi:Mg chelatase-related protein [Sulfurimonas denitrificans DSM 1251]|uniref:Mg chelatase-related protein n=1 Tax=Sulfurimonas denitrificans (strain ATCC 33889 / DSM 1251) TaxID=326298 RepID=Q30NX4_SULDN|nr:YifB family Mg chelatase-like AAA ATPase [Sulfurimonas denitrificans]ABB45307.1 Mg chelatase-related protein [Sulfurimonas denitrificans DSM 1251]MDD3442106.1 YifB family Mg chelatase-like AAA ATPase [Sulfurimonas denitrificans]
MKMVACATYEGIEAKVVYVESTLTKGLPSFSVVGMASASINEAKERVKSALLCNEFTFPPKRITINLAPSDVKKEGSQFDLSIALLIALDYLEDDLSQWFVFGELGLDGVVKENLQLYPLLLSLAKQKIIKKSIVPYESLDKLSNIPDIDFYGVKNLNEAIALLKNSANAMPNIVHKKIEYPNISVRDQFYYYDEEYVEDFLDVKGQEVAKRAALISAAGFHNILLEGSPGCGKSMIAQRLRYILPPLSSDEILDIAKLDALDGKEPQFRPLRTFRSPHHSSTTASVFGGGSHTAKIGEVGLAHRGILFFDELPHFSKSVLEALREPLQDNKIRISRVNSKIEYPSDFLFVSAMNPCPCGNLLHKEKECRCRELDIQRYKNRLSEPFLDRIDLSVVMQPVSLHDRATISSKEMHEKVIEVHKIVKQREQRTFTAKLSDAEVDKYCILDKEANDILQRATMQFALSFRAIKKVQKISRTIADLESSVIIEKRHILEALSYRRRG